MPPFFTIITSTYNAAATLPHLLDSLASQTCRDFNWIVQDGASSDATMQIVEQYRDCLPEILADSGKDSGIYDAWNKAIDRWQDKIGEWVLFLGADDKLASEDILAKVQKEIYYFPKTTIFAAGDIILSNEYGNLNSYFKAPSNTIAFKRKFYTMPFPHTGLFTRRSSIQKKFDTGFHIAGDYDFILREFQSPSQLKNINFFITHMGYGGISTTPDNNHLAKREMGLAIKKHSYFRFILFKSKQFKNYSFKVIKNNLLRSDFGTKIFFILKSIKNKFSK